MKLTRGSFSGPSSPPNCESCKGRVCSWLTVGAQRILIKGNQHRGINNCLSHLHSPGGAISSVASSRINVLLRGGSRMGTHLGSALQKPEASRDLSHHSNQYQLVWFFKIIIPISQRNIHCATCTSLPEPFPPLGMRSLPCSGSPAHPSGPSSGISCPVKLPYTGGNLPLVKDTPTFSAQG